MVNGSTPTPTRTIAFEWARIVGAVAQVLMLLIVAGGYYFTVRPYYQLENSKEHAAKLEQEVRAREEELELVQPRIDAAQSKIAELELHRDHLLAGIDEFEERLDDITFRLESTLWQQFLEELELRSRYRGLNSWILTDPNMLRDKTRRSWEIAPFGFEMEFPPDPAMQLLDAADAIQDQYPDDRRQARFAEQVRRAVEDSRGKLVCEVLDVPSLELEHGKELEAIRARIFYPGATDGLKGAALARREAELRIEEIDAVGDLRDRYSKKIYAITGACNKLRTELIEKLRSTPPPLP